MPKNEERVELMPLAINHKGQSFLCAGKGRAERLLGTEFK